MVKELTPSRMENVSPAADAARGGRLPAVSSRRDSSAWKIWLRNHSFEARASGDARPHTCPVRVIREEVQQSVALITVICRA